MYKTTNKCKQQKQIVNRHTEFSQFFSVLSVQEIQEQMDKVDDLYECNLKVVRWVEMVILGDPFYIPVQNIKAHWKKFNSSNSSDSEIWSWFFVT